VLCQINSGLSRLNKIQIFKIKYLPGVCFKEEPEFLEYFLPWNPYVQVFCNKRAVAHPSDHSTIARFRKGVLGEALEDLFFQKVEYLHSLGEVEYEKLLVDETKG
jgi:hypothetical protein